MYLWVLFYGMYTCVPTVFVRELFYFQESNARTSKLIFPLACQWDFTLNNIGTGDAFKMKWVCNSFYCVFSHTGNANLDVKQF